MNDLERSAIDGDSPVIEMVSPLWVRFPSTMGPVKPCGKLGGPPSKAKYSRATDSAQVP